jgi:rod shape-determining protein MreC
MSSSRDDFIIAIRSAFLKKSTKQKFSLLTLVFLSIFIIVLSSLNLKPIIYLRTIINELVYRTSYVVSIPENILKTVYLKTSDYSGFYNEFKNNEEELKKLRSENISSRIIKSENKELKNLIDDYTLSTNKILAKVIVDHSSIFLKTLIINKGSKDNIKIGTNIYDREYLVGRIIEVNYKTSRVLLLTDLNSNVPISITPGNIQAIVVGDGSNIGQIKYIKGDFINNIVDEGIAYTSGTGSIFKSGIPVGKILITEEEDLNKILVDFYTDFSQLKYVFAEIEKVINNSPTKNKPASSNEISNNEKIKLDLLNENKKILEESNLKYIDELENLKLEINKLDIEISNYKKEIISNKDEIDQDKIDKEELEFLRLNLIYGSKCFKSFFNKGYKVGSEDYKNCILRKGKKVND